MKTEFIFAERVRSQQALEQSEERYKRLLEATTDYIYTVEVENGQIGATFHDPGCESVTGYTRAEFAADPRLWYRIIHEQDKPAVLAQINRVLEGQLPPPLEHRIIHKQGEIRWVQNTPIPRRDPVGNLVGYDGLISDVTQRKRVEAELETERLLLRTLIDNVPDCIFVKDTESRFVLNNRAHLNVLGAGEPQEVVGKTDTEFFPKELAAQYRADEKTLVNSGQPLQNREEPVVDAAGRHYWFLTTKVPLKDSQGRVVGLAGICHDITERKIAAEHLQRAYSRLANRERVLKRLLRRLKASHRELKETQLQLIQAAKLESLGTLAAGVAHEVKNPLQIIAMGLDHLGRNVPAENEDLALTFRDMRDAVKRANAIVQEMLALSAATDFHKEPEELNMVIDRSLWLMRTELAKTHVCVQREFTLELPRVPMDRAKIEQVVINLVLNATQAMGRNGTLIVRTRVVTVGTDTDCSTPLFRSFRTGEVLVQTEVQDTGPGILEALRERVFDPFFTTKPVGVGTGLGLSVVKKIIDLHGGAIEIRNVPGGGAVARFVLRAHTEEVQT